MKILHILDHSIPLHSGYTFRTLAILKEQAKLGLETVQITSTKHYAEGPELEKIEGLRFYRTPDSRTLLSTIPVLNQLEVIRSLARRLENVVALERPDILHAHSPSLNGLAALQVAEKHHLPLVYECRAFWEDAAVDHGTIKAWGPRYLFTRWLESRVFHKADAVMTICEGLRSDIIKRNIPPSKITVIPNAVDSEVFSSQAHYDRQLAEELGIVDRPVIGFLGSFYHYEGLHFLIQALPIIRKQIPGASLLFVGGGPREQELKKQAEESPAGDSIIFTGRVPHSEVKRYYDLINVLAFPRISIRLTELVTPLKPLEAMAQGKLVVASDVGGHKELIQHGKNGYLYPAGDVSQLASAITIALQDDQQAEVIATYSQNYIETERNWGKSVANYLPVYASLYKSRAITQ